MPLPVFEKSAMIAGMDPRLIEGEVVFVAFETGDADALAVALPDARALIQEDEGTTLVLPVDHPSVPQDSLVMRQITCQVHSALDGVGLTAGISGALARHSIPCNVIAGYHHDHIFVPVAKAAMALSVLHSLADGAKETKI